MAKKQNIKKDEKAPEKFPVAVLRANCKQLFNIAEEVFNGVFFNFNEDLSKEEAKKKIDEWLGKEAK